MTSGLACIAAWAPTPPARTARRPSRAFVTVGIESAVMTLRSKVTANHLRLRNPIGRIHKGNMGAQGGSQVHQLVEHGPE
jgi:hypothetical protein